MPTYTTKEVAELCSINWSTLALWVRCGKITPVVMGRQGKGESHLFSERQVMGLAWIGGFTGTRLQVRSDDVVSIATAFDHMDEAEFSGYLDKTDPWAEERHVAYLTRERDERPEEPMPTDLLATYLPELRKVTERVEEVKAELTRRRKAGRSRRGTQDRRTATTCRG